MSVKKVPMRMCVGCRQMKPKAELMRVVKTQSGEISIDTTGRLNGRGAYLCKNAECIKKAKKQRSLSNAFGTPVGDGIYDRLEKEFSLIGE